LLFSPVERQLKQESLERVRRYPMAPENELNPWVENPLIVKFQFGQKAQKAKYGQSFDSSIPAYQSEEVA
jgi:hypothetical protein